MPPAAIKLVVEVGEAKQLMKKYSPDLTVNLRDTYSLENIYLGEEHPELSVMAAAYGRKNAKMWIAIQIHSFAKYCCAKKPFPPAVCFDLATQILNEFPYLKTTELMIWIAQMKTGRWGHIYSGTLDPMQIGEFLHKFVAERFKQIEYLERKREQERQDQQRLKTARDAITYEEYRRWCEGKLTPVNSFHQGGKVL